MPGTHTHTTACAHKVALLNGASPAGGNGQTREIHYMDGKCMASHHELAAAAAMMMLVFFLLPAFKIRRKRVVWEISALAVVEKRCAIKYVWLSWLVFESRGGLHVHRLGQFFLN